LNTVGDGILLAVHVNVWFVYISAFMSKSRFTCDCFL